MRGGIQKPTVSRRETPNFRRRRRFSGDIGGGGPGLVFNVNDTQLGAPAWPFADLERRFQRLFDLSHCTSCTTIFMLQPRIIELIVDMVHVVPVDIDPGDPPPFEVGPITRHLDRPEDPRCPHVRRR